MVNILLSVLKVIGIIIAVLLGLLLFLFLIILFGPITYRAEGCYNEEKRGTAGLNWLGIVLRCKLGYEAGRGTCWWIRLFGFLVASNDEEFLQQKKERQARRQVREAAKRIQREKKPAEISEEELSQEDIFQEDTFIEEKLSAAERIPLEEEPFKEENSTEEEPSGELKHPVEEEPSGELTYPVEEEVVSEKVAPDSKTLLQKEKTAFEHLRKKIKNIILKIKAIPAKIRQKAANLRTRIEGWITLKDFLFGERNRAGYLHIMKNLKKMVRHVLPVHIQGRIEFGLEDPYVMGQILALLGMFYPVYQDKLTLVPDFEEPCFVANGSLRGRIIPGYLVLKILTIICNGEVRRIIREGRELMGGKEA